MARVSVRNPLFPHIQYRACLVTQMQRRFVEYTLIEGITIFLRDRERERVRIAVFILYHQKRAAQRCAYEADGSKLEVCAQQRISGDRELTCEWTHKRSTTKASVDGTCSSNTISRFPHENGMKL
jgi:hypothetical protein